MNKGKHPFLLFFMWILIVFLISLAYTILVNVSFWFIPTFIAFVIIIENFRKLLKFAKNDFR